MPAPARVLLRGSLGIHGIPMMTSLPSYDSLSRRQALVSLLKIY